MTREELKNFRQLTFTIRYWENELAILRKESYTRSPQLTGLPGSGELKDPTGERALKEAKVIERIERLVTEQKKESERVMKWIQSIDDPLIQTIMHARYIRGKSWVAVGYLCGNTAENVHQIHSRYLSHLSHK